jgi:hypothetical protein
VIRLYHGREHGAMPIYNLRAGTYVTTSMRAAEEYARRRANSAGERVGEVLAVNATRADLLGNGFDIGHPGVAIWRLARPMRVVGKRIVRIDDQPHREQIQPNSFDLRERPRIPLRG